MRVPQRDGGRRQKNSELYYTRIEMLGIFLSLQFVPANFHAKREREMKRDRELRTLLPMDRDFRHLPILTICPCDSTCQYIHDNSKNIDYK